MPDRSAAGEAALVFRCDGGVTSGLGHVSRCLALAEALVDRGAEALFVGEHSAHARAMLEGARVARRDAGGPPGSPSDLADLRRLAAAQPPAAWVVDSYLVEAPYLSSLADLAPVVMLDDFAKLPVYPCTAVLNVTVTGLGLGYPPGPLKLLGPTYALARRSIRRLGRLARPAGRANRALVALGGVDRHGLTGRALDALASLDPGLSLRVVIRADDDHVAAIRRHAGAFASAEVQTNLDSLADAYAWADVCVAGGGLMKYECGLLGLPVGVLAQTTGEAEDVRRCAELGFVVDLGGPQEPVRPVADQLERLLHDAGLRGALHDASRAVFGDDPTARTADAVLALVRAGRVGAGGGKP